MTFYIDNENLRKINNLDEIPYKDLNKAIVKKHYYNHINYLVNLDKDEIDNQIQQDINDYNNQIDLITTKHNRITKRERNLYNKLLINLYADRYYNNYLRDLFNKDEDIDIDYDNSMLFNEDEKIFQDEVIKEHEEFLNELENYEKINSIDDLLSFSEDYEPDIRFIEDSNNYDSQTNNFKDEACLELINRFKKVDKAIKEYNEFINDYKNEKIVSRTIFDKVLNKIIKQSRKFKYYYYSKIEMNELYSVYTVYYIGYRSDFNKMLFDDFDNKYQIFKIKSKNTKKMFLMFRYYYLEGDHTTYHDTPCIDNNYLSPEHMLTGLTVKQITTKTGEFDTSDAKIEKRDEPMVNAVYSFKFFNSYDFKEYSISSEASEEYSNSDEIDRIAYDLMNKRVNRDGQLFPYKINKQAFKNYFGEYSQRVIDELYLYQIFEEFNAKRMEYSYNCLLYSIYIWFCINRTKKEGEEICNKLMIFNLNRLLTFNDIKAINEHFENNASLYKERYKIIIKKWNSVNNKMMSNNDNKDKSEKVEIPIALIESANVNDENFTINHFMIYNHPNFDENLLKLVHNLKHKDSKNNNFKQLTSYRLVINLLNRNDEYNFFIPFNTNEMKQILNEEDTLKTRLKGREIYDVIDEFNDYEMSKSNISLPVSSNPYAMRSKRDKNINDEVDDVISNQKVYDWLCFYDFEASTKEIGGHKAYMVCYTIMEFPKEIYDDDELKRFIKNFDVNDVKVLTNTKKIDCATAFLKALPNNTLCYAHNARYDISFFVYDNIKIIKPIEKDGNFYSTDILYDNKFITIKDSAKIIPGKLANFSEMFKLSDIDKDAFPFNFYTKENIEKYTDKDIKIGSREYKEIELKLVRSFNGYSTLQRMRNVWKFRKIIKEKCNNIFNMWEYSDLYYKKSVIKEIFPYDFYTCKNLEKYDNKDYDINSKEFKELEDEITKSFSGINDEERKQKYKAFKKVIITKFKGIFNMTKYSAFYCKRDVELLCKGMIHFRSDAFEILKLDSFKYLTISSMAHKFMMDNVYTKTGDEKLYMTTGILNQYIQSAVYGGVCTTYRNGKVFVKRRVTDLDKVSLYPDAMTRAYVVTGKCRKFNKDKIKKINDSMINHKGKFNNKNCWLLSHTNKENEFDKDKINMYIVTIRITKSSERDNPRIIVKNEVKNGKLKYPNLSEGSNTVNVNHSYDLNDPKYKEYFVNECIVTVDNITLEDYIKYHNIEFEVLTGVYWKNSEYISLYDCFVNISKLNKQLMNKKLTDSEKNTLYKERSRYIMNGDKLITMVHPELYKPFVELDNKYKEIQKERRLWKLAYDRALKENKPTKEFKDKLNKTKEEINDIKEKIYYLHDISGESKSSKQVEIQKVVKKLFDERAKYKKEHNPLEQVIKLVLNSIYGKTIQKPNIKKISYVELESELEIDLESEPKNRQKYIKRVYKKIKEDYVAKCNEKYNNDEITKDEYDLIINELDKNITLKNNIFTCRYSPFRNFLNDNKNKILTIEKINTNMFRIETIEQTEQHKSFNHIGVLILSLSKRIMNEVICLAQDNNINVYYQDTDSIHIESKYLKKLANLYQEEYGRKLIGKTLDQFHPDFEPCVCKNGESCKETLSWLSIFNSKKNYVDVKFNADCFGIPKTEFDITEKDINDVELKDNEIIGLNNEEIYELKKKKITYECRLGKYDPKNPLVSSEYEIDIDDYINYHFRLKGIAQEAIPATAYKYEMRIEELYLAGFNNDEKRFNISDVKPSFKFQHDFKVTTEELIRNIKTEGNRYIFIEGEDMRTIPIGDDTEIDLDGYDCIKISSLYN